MDYLADILTQEYTVRIFVGIIVLVFAVGIYYAITSIGKANKELEKATGNS